MGQISGKIKTVYAVKDTGHPFIKQWGRGYSCKYYDIIPVSWLLFFLSSGNKLRNVSHWYLES